MIRLLINFYIALLIIDFLIQLVPQIRDHKYVRPWHPDLRKITEFSLAPTRRLLARVLPKDNPFDASYAAVVLILSLIKVLW